MNYITFARHQFGFLSFGFLMIALGSFGQTWFIGLFAHDIRAHFELSATEFGVFYSAATLASGLLFFYTGTLFDSMRLVRYSLVVLAGLGVATILLGMAQNIVMLIMALFLLRHFGQGLSCHTGMTAMARAYDANRGRATAISQLGYSTAEGILPALVLALTLRVGWQESWQMIGLIVLLVMLPLCLWLTRFEPNLNINVDAQKDVESVSTSLLRGGHRVRRDFTRREVLRDMRFYFVLPLQLLPPVLFTGLFLNQTLVFESRGWHLNALAGAFMLYAVIKLPSSLIVGWLIDRYRAYNVQILSGIPLGLAFLMLIISPSIFGTFGPYIYMGLNAIGIGFVVVSGNTLWAEFYGTTHLGAIRALSSMLAIIGASCAPIIFGFAYDAGLGFNVIGIWALGFSGFAIGLAFMARHITLRLS